MPQAFSIEDLTFTYSGRDHPALKSVSGSMEEGSFLCIMGHGGAGKSSLCCSLNALIPKFFRGRYSGRVLVKGREVAKETVASMSRLVGEVFQDFESQLFSTNVELELAFGPENHGLPFSEIERRVREVLKVIGLEPFRKRQPATLSGGQKQRLAIGSILTLKPDILVLDEPTTDLDPQGAEEVLTVAGDLRKEGKTLVLVAPEPETAVNADALWLMRNGEVVARGTPRQVLTDLSSLRACGVKPPSLVELFQAMGWPGSPLTVEEALREIEKNRLSAGTHHLLPKETPSPSGGPFILEAEDLEFAYPEQEDRALKRIHWRVQEGEFVALIGQNGSGKTTLAKHCNGLLKPSSGVMRVKGKPTSAYLHKDLARIVGYVFQNPDHQIFARTVEEEVAFGLKVMGMDPRVIKERLAEALAVVELEGYEKKLPFTLTKGERQRVAVASVLAVRPKVIILDEPTTGLDYLHQRRMMDLLRRLHGQGHTVIIITHAMWVAAEYAQRTTVMKDGEIILDGPTRRVFAREEELKKASLSPPPLVRLGNRLGLLSMTLEDMLEELKHEHLPVSG
jgi:energy-coupling factor transport system ATP-binding protein